jgi:HEAT repeat protein
LNDKQNTNFTDNSPRIALLHEMENHFESSDIEYFKQLLHHEDNIIRTRAVCILAEIGDKGVVDAIGDTLTNDQDALVRHEAAFALGQMGFPDALTTLSHSINSDPSLFVRHEAAIAVGVIGSEKGRDPLQKALSDESHEVRESAKIALANLDYVSSVRRKGKFARLTGG